MVKYQLQTVSIDHRHASYYKAEDGQETCNAYRKNSCRHCKYL